MPVPRHREELGLPGSLSLPLPPPSLWGRKLGPVGSLGQGLLGQGQTGTAEAAGLGSGSAHWNHLGAFKTTKPRQVPPKTTNSEPRVGLGSPVFSCRGAQAQAGGTSSGWRDLAEGGQPPKDMLEGAQWLGPPAAHTPTPSASLASVCKDGTCSQPGTTMPLSAWLLAPTLPACVSLLAGRTWSGLFRRPSQGPHSRGCSPAPACPRTAVGDRKPLPSRHWGGEGQG